MRDYLVFQLYAPLVSWGDQAVGQERPSADHPSRSALLGLLAAAVGIDRNDETRQEQLSSACHFGIKLYAPGLAMRDFHTAQVPPANKKSKHLYTRRDELREPKLGTILSFRSYRQDSLSVVALWLNDDPAYSLPQLQKALSKPHFHLYLGRKACPLAVPLCPEPGQFASMKAALDHYAPADELRPLFERGQPRYYWEPHSDSGLEETYRGPRYDQPISRKRWQFASREEAVFLSREAEHVPE
ncbi:MAG: type I-E CRISPR-associated protein Cas5/CasD [Gammaproteobacteria bacterium]|nr:type I-E CRISPR-associated protein Cas5/CasD [Gammaproteobacteria bacterium]